MPAGSIVIMSKPVLCTHESDNTKCDTHDGRCEIILTTLMVTLEKLLEAKVIINNNVQATYPSEKHEKPATALENVIVDMHSRDG